jgi:hypothetical protein
MKPDTPRVRGKKDWSPMIRSVSFSLGLLVVIGSFVLANKPRKASPPLPPPKVLMIGDSLSVSGFGDAVQEHLEHRFGRENVAFFASCGSSPENWLQNEPVFHTRCGYREKTPTSDIYRDYHNGRRPPAVATPKIETLIERYKPTIVIVQLGTNWMDQTLSDNHIRAVLARFVSAAHRGGTRRMVWIGPPDSSRFSKGAESDLPADPAIGLAGRSSDRFTSIHSLCLGENWWRRGSLQPRIGSGMGEACDRQHRPGARGRHCGTPQSGQQSLAAGEHR